ncbi:transposase family protein [candidate division WOR-3 bacterium]|nr:transposase family protein [candidate division WOR-3 bacterium]
MEILYHFVAQESLESFPEGVRPIIQTDNGSGYISHEFKTVLKQFGVGHFKIHSYDPEENGLVEQSHRTILSSLDEVELYNYY